MKGAGSFVSYRSYMSGKKKFGVEYDTEVTVFHAMKVCWKRNSAGMTGRRLVNIIASVLWMLTRRFHLVKYRSSTDVTWVRLLTMVSVRQDCARIAVSSSYKAS